MTASVLLTRLTPTYLDRAHSPFFILASALGICRASEHMSATACSAAAMQLPVGAFTTMIPRSDAAGRSILSTPTPARPTTLSLVPAKRISLVTLMPDRTMSASYLGISRSSEAWSKVRSTVTWWCCSKMARPSLESFSGTRTLYLGTTCELDGGEAMPEATATISACVRFLWVCEVVSMALDGVPIIDFRNLVGFVAKNAHCAAW
mmetsp:Transcript_15136/g.26382  ORF Transcript_15136/g.26382 Transcript_15136/m.26382 type:complete len:206 (+) Transcript_15136:2225-2842(+)